MGEAVVSTVASQEDGRFEFASWNVLQKHAGMFAGIFIGDSKMPIEVNDSSIDTVSGC